MPEPDVLYAVRYSDRNNALRLSLRSLANVPHRRVFLAGHCPDWVRNVTHVEARRKANKYDCIQTNVLAGLRHPEIGEDVLYMNDDFYITEPVDRVPVMHGGLASGYRGKQELKIRMRNTVRALIERWPDLAPLSYDGTHVPLPLERDAARAILETAPSGIKWRTWYGNCHRIGGTPVEDAKLRSTERPLLRTYVSTSPKSLRAAEELLDAVLPKECEYV